MTGGFSEAMSQQERELKAFMYENLYHHTTQLEAAERARKIVSGLYSAYHESPANLPEEWRGNLPEEEPGRSRYIADFLAGMTDRFAEKCYMDIYGGIA